MANASMWYLPSNFHEEWCVRFYYRNNKESQQRKTLILHNDVDTEKCLITYLLTFFLSLTYSLIIIVIIITITVTGAIIIISNVIYGLTVVKLHL